MGFSQNVSYIFEGFTYPKCKLHFGEVPPAKRVGILLVVWARQLNRSSAARGGSGSLRSFKDRKLYEGSCCDAWVAGQTH